MGYEVQYPVSKTMHAGENWYFGSYLENRGNTSWADGDLVSGSDKPASNDSAVHVCNQYGVIFVDFSAIRAKRASAYPTAIRIRLRNHQSYARAVRMHMGKGINTTGYTSSTRPTDADTGDGTTLSYITSASIPANTYGELTITDANWLKALTDVDSTCFYINYKPDGSTPTDSGTYWEGDGYGSSYPPEVYVTWEDVYTKCGAPGWVSTAGELGTDRAQGRVDIAWGAGSGGTSNPVSSYYIQVRTAPPGQGWEAWRELASAPGTSFSFVPGDAAGTALQFRVKAVASAGATYDSDYTESNVITGTARPPRLLGLPFRCPSWIQGRRFECRSLRPRMRTAI
jgi:hypothetical protein